MSLLMWECGLKHVQAVLVCLVCEVTPYVGVWIETLDLRIIKKQKLSHSLCGSVD